MVHCSDLSNPTKMTDHLFSYCFYNYTNIFVRPFDFTFQFHEFLSLIVLMELPVSVCLPLFLEHTYHVLKNLHIFWNKLRIHPTMVSRIFCNYKLRISSRNGVCLFWWYVWRTDNINNKICRFVVKEFVKLPDEFDIRF